MSYVPSIDGTISAPPLTNTIAGGTPRSGLGGSIAAPVSGSPSSGGDEAQEGSAIAELGSLITSLGSLSAQAQSLPLSPPTLPSLPQNSGYQPQATDYTQLSDDSN